MCAMYIYIVTLYVCSTAPGILARRLYSETWISCANFEFLTRFDHVTACKNKDITLSIKHKIRLVNKYVLLHQLSLGYCQSAAVQ